jgi:hypothetical protein
MIGNYGLNFLLSALFLFLWIISLIVFNILGVVDELTGRKAKRQLKVIGDRQKEIHDTSEELRVLQQESLLDDELNKLSKDTVEVVKEREIKPVIAPIVEDKTDELVETGFEDEEKATGYLSVDEEDLSTGFLEVGNNQKSSITILKELSNRR